MQVHLFDMQNENKILVQFRIIECNLIKFCQEK